jgi:hypothetical protein
MPKALLCFDTEDFTKEGSCGAIIEIADICREEGVRANFMVIGYLARMLAIWGRDDVRKALESHEIHSHTLLHSVHPTINETTDVGSREEIAAAGQLIRRRTAHSHRFLQAFFGSPALLSACPPGSSKSYVAMYEYAKMGVPAYCDSIVDETHFCNLLHLDYIMSMEDMFLHDRPERIDPAIRKGVETAKSRNFTIFYSHPHREYYQRHWDIPDFKFANNVPWGQWTPCEREPAAVTQNFMNGLRGLIRALKAEGVDFCTIGDVVRAEASCPARIVNRSDCPALLSQLRENFGPQPAPCSLCLTDILQAAVHFLLRPADTFTPGFVYGFLETPQGITEPMTLTRRQLTEAARNLDFGTFLPERIPVGDSTSIGPADLLFAALAAVCEPEKEAFALLPCPQMPALEAQAKLIHCKLGHWINSPAYKDNHLSRRLPLQAWTLRPLAQFIH